MDELKDVIVYFLEKEKDKLLFWFIFKDFVFVDWFMYILFEDVSSFEECCIDL